jgi:hypothetical protein
MQITLIIYKLKLLLQTTELLQIPLIQRCELLTNLQKHLTIPYDQKLLSKSSNSDFYSQISTFMTNFSTRLQIFESQSLWNLSFLLNTLTILKLGKIHSSPLFNHPTFFPPSATCKIDNSALNHLYGPTADCREEHHPH